MKKMSLARRVGIFIAVIVFFALAITAHFSLNSAHKPSNGIASGGVTHLWVESADSIGRFAKSYVDSGWLI
jgi:hypothetical protein